jgi:hypothetical protein
MRQQDQALGIGHQRGVVHLSQNDGASVDGHFADMQQAVTKTVAISLNNSKALIHHRGLLEQPPRLFHFPVMVQVKARRAQLCGNPDCKMPCLLVFLIRQRQLLLSVLCFFPNALYIRETYQH